MNKKPNISMLWKGNSLLIHYKYFIFSGLCRYIFDLTII